MRNTDDAKTRSLASIKIVGFKNRCQTKYTFDFILTIKYM